MIPSPTDLSREDLLCLWVNRNRGVCAKIARDYEVTGSFVRAILHGSPGFKSADLRVERALAEAGAPFMKERLGESD